MRKQIHVPGTAPGWGKSCPWSHEEHATTDSPPGPERRRRCLGPDCVQKSHDSRGLELVESAFQGRAYCPRCEEAIANGEPIPENVNLIAWPRDCIDCGKPFPPSNYYTYANGLPFAHCKQCHATRQQPRPVKRGAYRR